MERLLEGVKILDMSQMLSGPYGSLLLADCGAEVIKVEDPGQGDRIRGMAPHFIEGHSAYFVSINRNKKSIILNLKDPAERDVFYELVKKADVVWDNFKPGTSERLGIDYETLKDVNPRIIVSSISAFGYNGPYKDQPAFDLSIQAMSGAMSITGEEGRVPVRMGIPMGDLAGGTLAAYAVAAALYRREKTGEGCWIEISLLDSLISLLTYVGQYYFHSGDVPKPIGSGHQSVVPYHAYRTKTIDIVVAIFTEKFWSGLCKVLGMEEYIDDDRFNTNAKRSENRDQLNPVISERLLERPGEEWLKEMADIGIPAAPINDLEMLFNDPQVLAREMVVDLKTPGGNTIKTIGNPVRVQGIKDTFVFSPIHGEHTEEVITELLGAEAYRKLVEGREAAGREEEGKE
jgi:crotonobetainyl-CoA:carnitine CoA-transferase CaiB-like acyl-CoA transferase